MTLTTRGTTGIDDPAGSPSVNMRGEWHFWTLRYDGRTKLQRGDGRTEYEVADSGRIAPAPDRLVTLGARHDGVTSFTNRGNWEVGEVIFFNRALAFDEIYMLENYLSRKWDLTLADGTHPMMNPEDGNLPSTNAELDFSGFFNPTISSASISFAENLPAFSDIGNFWGIDRDGNNGLVFALANGVGDTHNSLFTLDTNGTLKSATIFDYETNASTYSIRVQAKDEYNASMEGNFTVTLTNDITEDTDGDGFSEADEVSAGTDPNDAANKPGLDFGLVAWYPFDGNASDMSGNGNHGTVNGALPWERIVTELQIGRTVSMELMTGFFWGIV